ncbi:hypothetical protein K0M31_013310 [Melipona bicolor]|uniref:Uncharacterized protein n=1 Tax=Melipona bicolor TaxID=60889 RepID=A0AA40KGS5_9HYME|nr:hypothetical protein K0M31_013310 [Melipona bicolor]
MASSFGPQRYKSLFVSEPYLPQERKRDTSGDNGVDRLKEKAVEIAWRGGRRGRDEAAMPPRREDFLTCWAAKLPVLKRAERE